MGWQPCSSLDPSVTVEESEDSIPVYVVYLAVILIWWFGEFLSACQI